MLLFFSRHRSHFVVLQLALECAHLSLSLRSIFFPLLASAWRVKPKQHFFPFIVVRHGKEKIIELYSFLAPQYPCHSLFPRSDSTPRHFFPFTHLVVKQQNTKNTTVLFHNFEHNRRDLRSIVGFSAIIYFDYCWRCCFEKGEEKAMRRKKVLATAGDCTVTQPFWVRVWRQLTSLNASYRVQLNI